MDKFCAISASAIGLRTCASPDSASLAEACEQNKDTELATKHYQRSLELNPKNDNGRRRLEALRSMSGPR